MAVLPSRPSPFAQDGRHQCGRLRKPRRFPATARASAPPSALPRGAWPGPSSGRPSSPPRCARSGGASLRRGVPARRGPDAMPKTWTRAAARAGPPASAWRTAACASAPWRCRARPSARSAWTPSPLSAPAASRRIAGPSTDRWRSPVWEIGHPACPRGCGVSPRERTPQPGSMRTSPVQRRAGPARWFPSLAWKSPLSARCASGRAAASPAARIQEMDPATLQQLREQSGLRLDKEGRFWHRGGLVEHARTLAALHQGIHRAADGRWATRIGRDWAYLDVEDAALWLRRIEPSGASLRGQLASGEWVQIDPATLAAGADDALYARVGGERARLTRDAQLSLGDHLFEDGQDFVLQLGSRRFRIGEDAGPEPVRPPDSITR